MVQNYKTANKLHHHSPRLDMGQVSPQQSLVNGNSRRITWVKSSGHEMGTEINSCSQNTERKAVGGCQLFIRCDLPLKDKTMVITGFKERCNSGTRIGLSKDMWMRAKNSQSQRGEWLQVRLYRDLETQAAFHKRHNIQGRWRLSLIEEGMKVAAPFCPSG